VSFIVCSSQDHLRIGIHDLDHPISCRCKKHRQLACQEGRFAAYFLIDEVLMVPSSSIAIAADGKSLTCGGFSLDELVHLGSIELIVDYFDGLSLSSRRGNDGAVFMGSTSSRASTLQRATIKNSPEEFFMMSSGEGSFGHHSPRRRSTGSRSPPLQPRHGRRTLQPRRCFPRGRRCRGQKPTSPPSDIMLTMKENQRNPALGIPMSNQDWRHNGATMPMGRPQPRLSQMGHLSASL
jgi:hypothetical protein